MDERATREAAREVVAQVQRGWGQGWDRLTPEMRQALVSQRVLGDVMTSTSESVAVEDVRAVAHAAWALVEDAP